MAEFAQWLNSEMNRADVHVTVPPEPEGDTVWTQRDMFSTTWRRWTRLSGFPGRSQWTAAGEPSGFSHTWGSLHVYHRRVVTSDPTVTEDVSRG